jgi:uncharacterized sulfatase
MDDDPPNIVWLTLESVRADHTTMGGYERNTTPSIQQLAERSDATAFENCFAHSMWTPASSASILTGTYLSEHGIGQGGGGMGTLPSHLTTLPAELAKRGYRTACLSPNGYLSSANGLDRGFQDFYWLSKNLGDSSFLDVAKRMLNVGSDRDSLVNEINYSLLKYGSKIRKHGPGFTLDRQQHHLSYVVTDLAKRWTSSVSENDDPFFLYAHVGNPHHPYCPPRLTRERFAESMPLPMDQAIELALDTYADSDEIRRLNAHGCPLTTAEWETLRALYDAEISYADYCIGQIVEHVRSLDDGNTVVVVTADHGELFGEYGLVGHNLVLHDALVHVPLVVAGLDLNRTGDGLVQHADVTRTLAELAGCGHEQFSGYDLRTESREYCLSQRGSANLDPYFDLNPDFETDHLHEGRLSAVRTLEFKYLESTTGSELFALPDEETDVSDDRPEVVEDLSSVVDARVDWESSTDAERAEFTEEMREQLSDLGYL